MNETTRFDYNLDRLVTPLFRHHKPKPLWPLIPPKLIRSSPPYQLDLMTHLHGSVALSASDANGALGHRGEHLLHRDDGRDVLLHGQPLEARIG